ncbi:MAG: Holliday junction branch migration protein RuvA [Mariprofundales bacterium]|nr:Holliday junction branch migration protein RuvA [Mariprofundales bacterium]
MIGWLGGLVRHCDPTGTVLVDTGGVGYEVTVSMQSLANLQLGHDCELFIHTYVREDQLVLFGFATTSERELFRRLITVSGIGAKMALNLLSTMTSSQLLSAIDQADTAMISRTPGVGKKTAQRLILELKGKLQLDGTTASTEVKGGYQSDMRSALTNLGYKPASIDHALRSITVSGDFEQDFKLALKALL